MISEELTLVLNFLTQNNLDHRRFLIPSPKILTQELNLATRTSKQTARINNELNQNTNKLAFRVVGIDLVWNRVVVFLAFLTTTVDGEC
jgi:hypothetical protein